MIGKLILTKDSSVEAFNAAINVLFEAFYKSADKSKNKLFTLPVYDDLQYETKITGQRPLTEEEQGKVVSVVARSDGSVRIIRQGVTGTDYNTIRSAFIDALGFKKQRTNDGAVDPGTTIVNGGKVVQLLPRGTLEKNDGRRAQSSSATVTKEALAEAINAMAQKYNLGDKITAAITDASRTR